MSKSIAENHTLAEATKGTGSGLLEVEFITPGWGSSGFYSKQVVESAVPLFKKGTQMFFDHPTEEEAATRPGRSVRDMAAVLEEDARLDPKTGGIRGKVRPIKAYADLLTDEAFAKNVGLSIRGDATDIVEGTAEGRTGRIVEGLAHIKSVDFVTKAGRGGKVLQVLESAQLEEQVLAVDEATASDRMSHLRAAVRTAHSATGNSVYVRDQDAEKSTVWFDIHDHRSGDGTPKSYEQSYTVGKNDVDVQLTGTPVEVRPVTNYVPVTRPGGNTPTTEGDQEVTMGNIQIEESEHKALTEKAGRVDALESERDTEKASRIKAEEALATRDRNDAAAKIVVERAKEGQVEFSTLESRGLLADLPLKEGALDTEAFTKVVDEAAAEKAKAGGAGSITGFGGSSTGNGTGDISEADIDKAVAGAFGRTVKEA